MNKLVTVVAVAALASAAFAKNVAPATNLAAGVTNSNATIVPFDGTMELRSSVNAGTADIIVDVTFDNGLDFWDLEGDLDNVILSLDFSSAGVPANAEFVGIGWDTVTTSFGASWGSEATISVANTVDPAGLFLTTSLTDAPVAGEVNSSGGVLDLSDNAIPNIALAGDGTLLVEAFESFDDVADEIDNIWEAGSRLSFAFTPEPTSLLLLGLGALIARRR